jgi:PAS domain S-box-containing protein
MSDSLFDKASAVPERRSHVRRGIDAEQDHLAHILASLPDAVLCFDHNWVITFANAEAIRISRIQSADIHNKTYWQLFPSALGSSLEQAFREVMQTGIPQRLEYFFKPFRLWVEAHIFPSQEGLAVHYRDITDRKQAEAHHDTSIRRHQQILDAAPDSIICIDRNWNCTFANRAALSILKADTLVGENLWQRFPLNQQEPFRSNYLRTMEQRIPTDFDAYYPHPLDIWFKVSVRPYEDGIIIYSSDVTDRKGAELLRDTSARQLHQVLETTTDAVITINRDWNLSFLNRRARELLSPKGNLLGKNLWQEFTFATQSGEFHHHYHRAMDRGIPGEFETFYPDPLNLWLSIQCHPFDDGIVVFFRDITRRRLNEETLRSRQEESERRRTELETIYRTAPVGLALFDATDLRYLRINDRQAETIGLPKEKIIGQVITDIIPLKGLKELLLSVAAGNSVRNQLLEGELPARPGEHRYWNCSYSPVYNSNGRVEAIAATVLEITNQKKAEAALLQSEKLAAVGRLASSISHEINNPLESITNLLYLINLSEELPKSLRSYVQTAQAELSRVCQIATQTLRFHRQAVRATHVNAADLVNAVLNLYQGRLVNSHIQVEAAYSTSTKVLCFENDIRQVLNNLIANSIDAMRTGGRLVVRAHDAHDLSDTGSPIRQGIRITIADTGHGMSPAVRARIFEPFYTTKELNGTGLGLWISADIIGRHQGRLNLRSTEHHIHHGTIVSLFLPGVETS